ncbi:acyl-CoA dehydrogenase family protein [Erythrobacter aurantius]|uniref:acyl-CoA dehydrogenase family protein n=1 Tax=Erythrobacter aurantius TaxID=2909249 RepID=UPI0020799F9B|nr:acyl-CoA dehydrogenase family protein [Erythrobacter aurantius]
MDLDFTEEQDLLRETTRRICDASFDSCMVRALEKQDNGFNRAFWHALGEAGLCGLRIDESHSGAELGSLELAILFEEFGRKLASSPFMASCVHAAAILGSAGGEMAREWLPAIAQGEAIVVPAWIENDLGPAGAGTTARFANGRLHATKSLVPFAGIADAFLVHAECSEGHCWVLVPRAAEGVQIAPQVNHASQPVFQVSFDAVPVSDALVIAATQYPMQDSRFEDVLIATAAEAVGAADSVLAITCNYANERQQFGRLISAFQAISHPLAECATELEAARYLTYQAAWAKDEGRPCTRLAQMAKVAATRTFRRTATVAVQVHGGLGYATEGEPQLYYRRSKHHELNHGTPASLRAEIAAAILD